MKSEKMEYDDLLDYDEFVSEFTASKKRKLPDKSVFLIFALILLVFCAVSGFAGYQIGYRSIYGEGYQDGYDEGNDAGYNDGLEIGKKDGYDVGYEEGGEAAKNDLYYGIYGGEVAASSGTAVGGDVVYLTASGTCYHFEGCSYIAGKNNLRTMSESEAINSGYSSCSRCGKE